MNQEAYDKLRKDIQRNTEDAEALLAKIGADSLQLVDMSLGASKSIYAHAMDAGIQVARKGLVLFKNAVNLSLNAIDSGRAKESEVSCPNESRPNEENKDRLWPERCVL